MDAVWASIAARLKEVSLSDAAPDHGEEEERVLVEALCPEHRGAACALRLVPTPVLVRVLVDTCVLSSRCGVSSEQLSIAVLRVLPRTEVLHACAACLAAGCFQVLAAVLDQGL